MPIVRRIDGFRLFFYANEGSPREPMHIHALRNDSEAKFWLWPQVVLAYNDGFNARVLRELTEIVEQHRDEIARVWDEFFSDG